MMRGNHTNNYAEAGMRRNSLWQGEGIQLDSDVSVCNGDNGKFAKPFHGPFRIVELTHTNASVRPVDNPPENPVFVYLDRVRHCPEELPSGETWFGTTKKR